MKPSLSTSSRARLVASSRQRGVTLVVVLLLLLVVTLIALASLRGTLMEERMSANARDRGLAFQAAEAALRKGESVAGGLTLPASGCSAGVCAISTDPSAAPVWEDETVWASAPEADVKLGDQVAKPRYIVELLADDVPPRDSCTTAGDVSETTCSGEERRFRITARVQADGRASVMLQSIYAVP